MARWRHAKLVLIDRVGVVLDRVLTWGLQRLRSVKSDEKAILTTSCDKGKPTIKFINDELPHAGDPIKAIELQAETDCRIRAPTRVLATSSPSSLPKIRLHPRNAS